MRIANGTAISLPLSQVSSAGRGSALSRWPLLLAVLAGPATATTELDAQLAQAVRARLEAPLNQEVQRRGWREVRMTLPLTVVGSRPLQPCPAPPRAEWLTRTAAPFERQRLLLSCAGQPSWQATVLVTPHLSLPVLVAQAPLERGRTLAVQDVRPERQALGQLSRGFYQDATALAGEVARRRIRTGQVLTPELVMPPLLVRRGQPVTVVARQDDIEVSITGEALSDGRRDDVVRVRNSGSGAVMTARVVERDRVESLR